MAAETYRIEHCTNPEEDEKNQVWKLSNCWWGLPKSKMQGAMMVLDAMYGGGKYRAVSEQTTEVKFNAGGRQAPHVNVRIVE